MKNNNSPSLGLFKALYYFFLKKSKTNKESNYLAVGLYSYSNYKHDLIILTIS